MHQLLAFHHHNSKVYIENKVHKGDKLKAQKQIYLHIDFSHMTNKAWKIRVERRENGSEKLFSTQKN